MPPTTRRAAASKASRTPSQQGQQTLNFRATTKVTKSAAVPSKHPKAHDAPSIAVEIPIHKPKPTAAHAPTLEEELATEKTAAKAEEPAVLTPTPATEPEPEPSVPTTCLTSYTPPSVIEKPLSHPSVPPILQDLPETVTTSVSKLTQKDITTYHKTVLSTRPVHQSGLSTPEKILRYFDLSSQYGPCIGITRINRWKRAYRMGMDPPIEVLKCLMEVEEREGKVESGFKGVGGGGVGGHKRDERTAFVDEELSSRTAQE